MSRLGTGLLKKDWLHAGQDILRAEGVDGISLKSLTDRLGVTKGSFYHHFKCLDDYLTDLANYFSGDHLALIFDQAREEAKGDPVAELESIRRIIEADDGYRLMSAMRMWAKSNEVAAKSIEKLDDVARKNLVRIFRDMGFAPQDAKVRAFMVHALGVTDIDRTFPGLSYEKLQKAVLDILIS
ncbi:MAG: TetR/AcrR family transcriptional regulator [Alphaproteobacteria bacterium]|nr:TetR/AcrR family transcriptional regulator [Alphaproteobacteria bacterium]MBO6629701.1 TetR/AcrR family transcriptional regulator [Alphaproteobacteria bacterium]MDF1625828.1 TetR/AcrR family transcriptional regulator [Parvibaculaceae bacterium]|tara:strand:+ start:137 stop:685 length:549 start_codon:yes stop_codon:yes gene_type:complete